MTRKQCWGKVAPTVWIDECERADEIVEPLSVHALRLLPEFSVNDLVQLQAEDGIRDFCLSRGLGDVYKRQPIPKVNGYN